jgi:hypothetical protein
MINFYHEAGILKTYGVHPGYPRHPWLVLLVPAPAGLGLLRLLAAGSATGVLALDKLV